MIGIRSVLFNFFSLPPPQPEKKEKEESKEEKTQTNLEMRQILQPLSNEVSYSAGGPIHLNPSGKRSTCNISQSKYFLTNLLIMHSNKLFAACGELLLDFPRESDSLLILTHCFRCQSCYCHGWILLGFFSSSKGGGGLNKYISVGEKKSCCCPRDINISCAQNATIH